MAKKKNSLNWISLILIIFLIAIIVLVILGFKLGWFARFFVPTGIDKDSFDTLPVGDCELDFNKELYCEDELMYAKLTDGKNAQCVVGQNYNNEGWKLIREDGKILILNTDEYGKYSASPRAGKSGSYIYAVICLDEDQVLCRTNDVNIEVEVCPDEGAYTCGWVGNQCGGTCPTSHPLCVDVWFENNALFGDDGYVACVCLNPDTEEVHPDWKPDGQYHDNSGYPEEDIEDYTCGQGSDSQCGGTCPSDYPYCSKDFTDLYLYNCVCKNSNGDIHPEWESGGSMFNEQGEYPPEESDCVDSDGVNVFFAGVTTYLGDTHPDVCHAGYSYAVDEYVCIDDVAVKKEIQCPYSDCVNGKCTSGTTTVYNECLNLGYANGGGCYSGSSGVLHPELDTYCGDLYPLNHAQCFS